MACVRLVLIAVRSGQRWGHRDAVADIPFVRVLKCEQVPVMYNNSKERE